MNSEPVKVAIIGAGPGGLFAANEILNLIKKVEIVIIDKGKIPTKRICPALSNSCINCRNCDLISGGGGAGLFSDGKLIMDIYSGGYLQSIVPSKKKEEIENRIKSVFEKFSLKYLYKNPTPSKDVDSCIQKQNLCFKSYPVIHIGSNNLRHFTSQFLSYLKKRGVKFLFNTEVKEFQHDASSGQWIIKTVNKEGHQTTRANYLIVAVGKEGSFWFTNLIEKLGGTVENNNTYIGVRMEINDLTARNFYNLSFDPKFSFRRDDVKIKTHCFCRHGQVLLLKYSPLPPKYSNLPLAGGHTLYIEIDEQYNTKKFPNSNFAVLYRDRKVCNRESALEVMMRVNEITNGKLLVQRLGDFIENIPTSEQKLKSNSIKPSNLNIAPGKILDDLLPGFREIFILFLERLESCVPGIMNPDNLLYFPAIEWWMRKVKVNNNMEVIGLPNLYAVGDGSGWTQGIVQSAATGIIAAEDISQKNRM